jgi:hypothetical protein
MRPVAALNGSGPAVGHCRTSLVSHAFRTARTLKTRLTIESCVAPGGSLATATPGPQAR